MEGLDSVIVALVIGLALVGIAALLRAAFPAQVPRWCRRHRHLVAVMVPLLMAGGDAWAATQRFDPSLKASALTLAATVAALVLGRYVPVRSARARRPAVEPERFDAGTREHLRRSL